MTDLPLHTAALLLSVYVLIGLVNFPRSQWRPLALATLPLLAAALLIGFAWSRGIVLSLVFVVAMVGFQAQKTVENAPTWLLAQLAVLIAMVALVLRSGASDAAPLPIVVALVLLAGAVVTVEWGGEWVSRAIKPFADALTPRQPHAAEDGIEQGRGLPGGFPDGGRMIGRLERLLIFLFVIVGTPTAIGFLVAAKSVLRLGEIRDSESRKDAEYIIIGTLMSFGIALVASYATQCALSVLITGSPFGGWPGAGQGIR